MKLTWPLIKANGFWLDPGTGKFSIDNLLISQLNFLL
jgi:hypothetical protein